MVTTLLYVYVLGQINQSQSLFTYAQNESVDTFSDPDFVPMFADNITWYNDSVRQAAEAQCGDDQECLFDVASTNDLSVGLATKDISIQLVNETNILGESFSIITSDILNQCYSVPASNLEWFENSLERTAGVGETWELEKNEIKNKIVIIIIIIIINK